MQIFFNYLGKMYRTTTKEAEAIYRYKQNEYWRLDAHNRLVEMRGTEGDADELDMEFLKEYGVDFARAVELIPEMVERFEKVMSTDTSENDSWELAIGMILEENRLT